MDAGLSGTSAVAGCDTHIYFLIYNNHLTTPPAPPPFLLRVPPQQAAADLEGASPVRKAPFSTTEPWSSSSIVGASAAEVKIEHAPKGGHADVHP